MMFADSHGSISPCSFWCHFDVWVNFFQSAFLLLLYYPQLICTHTELAPLSFPPLWFCPLLSLQKKPTCYITILYLLVDSDPRRDVLHSCIQQAHAQNLETTGRLCHWHGFCLCGDLKLACVAVLTGNLLNRSMNIWVVRGLFLLLMKELSACLKTAETRSTSTFPINLSCKHRGSDRHYKMVYKVQT